MERIKEFWSIYDKYIQTGDKILRKELSDLLARVEEKGREKQLFRPEKGWNRILAWQVLRTEKFIYPRVNQPVLLYEGEILAWTPCWDRDVYLTRIPYHEEVSGYIIRPGYYLECDKKTCRIRSGMSLLIITSSVMKEDCICLCINLKQLKNLLLNKLIWQKKTLFLI